MRAAIGEVADWFFEPELVRLRRLWVAAFYEWDRAVADQSTSIDVVLTDEQRTKLRRYHDAEAAYFARCRALSS